MFSPCRLHAAWGYIASTGMDLSARRYIVNNGSFFRRIPVLLQMNATECGAACLAMVLNYYGRKISVGEVNEHCGSGRDGLSALNIVQAARDYRLHVRAIALQENDF